MGLKDKRVLALAVAALELVVVLAANTTKFARQHHHLSRFLCHP
jgi:hypothetical protein